MTVGRSSPSGTAGAVCSPARGYVRGTAKTSAADSRLARPRPFGVTLDGEIVCWTDGHLDFAGLQRGQRDGICFVAFDVLRLDG